jgi:hypothetical protein
MLATIFCGCGGACKNIDCDTLHTQILSLFGSITGQNNELCFSSFNNKKRKVVEKRFKGYAG